MSNYNLKTPDRPAGLLQAVEKLMYWAQVSLPAVYGEELTYAKEQGKMAQKINEIVEQLNVNTEWTEYLLNEGVENETITYINELIANGTLGSLINNELLGNINKKLDTKRDKNVPIDMGDLSQGVKEAMTGGSVAVVGVKSITSENIIDGKINEFQTSYMNYAPDSNYLNKKSSGYAPGYVLASSGLVTPNEVYDTTDYIPCYSGDVFNTNYEFRYAAYYDSQLNVIPPLVDRGTTTTCPTNGKYIRISFNNSYTNFTIAYNRPALINGSPVVTKNKYQRMDIDNVEQLEGKIADYMLQFEPGSNLVSTNGKISDYFVNEVNGKLSAASGYYAYEFIPVTPGETIYVNTTGTMHGAIYNKYKVFTRGIPIQKENTLLIGEDEHYIRVSSNKIAQCWVTRDQSPYEDYYLNLPIKKTPPTYPAREYESYRLDFLIGNNLLNEFSYVDNMYVNETNGKLTENPAYQAFNYIPVKAGDVISGKTGVGTFHGAFYDEQRNYLSGMPVGNSFTVTVEKDGFIRLSVSGKTKSAMVNYGDTVLPRENYKMQIPIDPSIIDVSGDNIVGFLLPSYQVAIGRTIELYYDQMFIGVDWSKYSVKVTGGIGKPLKRKLSITGTSGQTGTYPVTFELLRNDNALSIMSMSTNIVVKSNITLGKRILTIGDSLSNNKPWYAELRTLSGGTSGITFVGTNGEAPLQNEGYSGFAPSSFLTATNKPGTSTIQPFWNPTSQRFDYNYYKSTTGVTPDEIIIFLGTNGLTQWNEVKQIVDYIRQDDANIKIWITMICYWANQNGIGQLLDSEGHAAIGLSEYQVKQSVYTFNKNLYELLKSYANVGFVPLAYCFDSKYNYGVVPTDVNPRNDFKEYFPTNDVHPYPDSSYLQYSDVFYSALV